MQLAGDNWMFTKFKRYLSQVDWSVAFEKILITVIAITLVAWAVAIVASLRYA